MKKNYLLYGFSIALIAITLGDLITENKEFSEFENRRLKTKVKISYKNFLNGDLLKDYDKYVSDQFIFRDKWITLKGINEKVLGKSENNGVLLGKKDYLFDKYFNLDKHRKDYNVESLKNFSNSYSGRVSFMLVPNSHEIYRENLKNNPPLINQKEEIKDIYSKLNKSNNINLLDKFLEEKEKGLYYKTDHHWNLNGAYLGYLEFIKSVNKEPVDILDKKISVENFYGTFYSKAKPINNKGDIFCYVPLENLEMEIGREKYSSIYNLEYLEKRDKYEMFLYGNNPYTKITNKNIEKREKILVIKDSYANSLVPFLTQNYREVHVIDLRSFGKGVKEFLKKEKIDEVLVLYNFNNFCLDGNFLRINK